MRYCGFCSFSGDLGTFFPTGDRGISRPPPTHGLSHVWKNQEGVPSGPVGVESHKSPQNPCFGHIWGSDHVPPSMLFDQNTPESGRNRVESGTFWLGCGTISASGPRFWPIIGKVPHRVEYGVLGMSRSPRLSCTSSFVGGTLPPCTCPVPSPRACRYQRVRVG